MISAVYRSPEIPEHQGNPLIEALPPVLNVMDTLAAITNLPKCDPQERTHPSHLRLHYLDRLFDVVQAQPEHGKVANVISRLIRHGYKSRNPLVPAYHYHAYQLATRDLETVRPPPNFAKCRTGAYLTGLSGIGKSTIVDRILSLYPQTIVHEQYRGQQFTQTQVAWLKLDCPHDGSQKQLCLNFFSALDDALGGTTDYFGQNVGRRCGVEGFVPVMHRLIHTYHIGFLVLDELQHLTSAPRGGETKTLNLLVNLINRLGLPLLLVGTFESASLFSKTFRNARRVAFAGPMIMDRYAKDDPRWHFFLETIWHYQFTKTPIPLDENMSVAMHDASQGVTDVAVAVYMICQEFAITAGKEEVFSVDLVRRIIPNHLAILQPALGALQRSDTKAYEQFRELLPPADQWRQSVSGSDDESSLASMLETLINRQAERLNASSNSPPMSEAGASDTSDPSDEEHGMSDSLPLPDINAHVIGSAQRKK